MAETSDPHVTSSRKRWVPLENNPSVMTPLAHNLGLSPTLSFTDVYSLTDADLLSLVPRPVLALLFLYPVSEASEKDVAAEDAPLSAYSGSGPDEPVLWVKQTIGNACGLYGMLYCVCNGPARGHIVPGSDLAKLVAEMEPLSFGERADVPYHSAALEAAHAEAAQRGDSKAPDAEGKVGLAYVSFVKGKDGHLWELEGRRKGPIRRVKLAEDEDLLSEKAMQDGPLRLINREKAGEGRYSCLALVESGEEA